MKQYYMHLMDGKPAWFDKETRMIYFISKFHKLKKSDILCTSLDQLRREQNISIKTRSALHIDASAWDMDYLRIPRDES